MIHSKNETDVFGKLRNMLIDMGNPENQINGETNFQKDLGFDYFDLVDFLIRIEKEYKIRIDISIFPNSKYPQFEDMTSIIDFLSKEYNII